MSRILGLDVGDIRIGVALSDPLGILASPLAIVNRDDEQTAIEKIAGIVRQHEVGRVIAGLPLNMDGSMGEQAGKTMSFIAILSRYIDVPVEYRDERLTTVSARELIQGVRRTNRNTRYDAAAAAIILQSYLDAKAQRRPDDLEPHAE
jgi:putative Holliday junction resolvase